MLLVVLLASACPAGSPVPGPVVILRPYAPEGPFGGHWGVDLAAPVRSEVRSLGPGAVTFAGTVAGTTSVTVDHGGGLRTSYSYLSAVSTGLGPVGAGALLGRSGRDHGLDALHLSVRVGDRYIDPVRLLTCRLGPPGDALRLAS